MKKLIISLILAFAIAFAGLLTVNVGSASAALVFHSGFEGGSTFEWSGSGTGTLSIQTGIKMTGAYAMRCNETMTTGYVTDTTATVRRMTFYLYIGTAPSVLTTIVGSDTSGGRVRLTTARYLTLYDGGTLRGTSTTQLSTATWYRISIGIAGGATTDWLAIDGTKEIQNVTVSALGANRIGVITMATTNLYFDDVAIDNTFSTTDLGNIRVLLSLPNAAGNYSQFDTPTPNATHYLNVDDAPGAISDADYNQQAARAAAYDTYHIQDASTIGIGTDDTINATRYLGRMMRGGGGAASHHLAVRDNGSDYTTAVAATTSFAWYWRYDAVMPSDSQPWTQARFNSFEVGAYHGNGGQDTYISACMVMVAYTPAPNIANAPTSKDFGVVIEDSTNWSNGTTPPGPTITDNVCYFQVTNNSYAPINITISATNFSGGASVWTLISGSPTGLTDQVRMTAYRSGDSLVGGGLILTNSAQPFISALGATPSINNTKKWEIELEAGTFSEYGVQKTSTVTLTASYS